jgi:hypothetical protein
MISIDLDLIHLQYHEVFKFRKAYFPFLFHLPQILRRFQVISSTALNDQYLILMNRFIMLCC